MSQGPHPGKTEVITWLLAMIGAMMAQVLFGRWHDKQIDGLNTMEGE